LSNLILILICRYDLVRNEFGRSVGALSKIFKYFVLHCFARHRHKLCNNLDYWVPHMAGFAELIRRKLESLNVLFDPNNFSIFGFIDDYSDRICRVGGGPAAPGGVDADRNDYLLQEAFWNGWKKIHGLHWQVHKY